MDKKFGNGRKPHAFFSHKSCEYFPCHETGSPDDFNCLFCFCPLYCIECGGDADSTEDGIKDCSRCFFPHERSNFEKIIERLTAARKGGKPDDTPAA